MKINSYYDFFFHPLSDVNEDKVKPYSIATTVALSLITGGAFLLLFGAMQIKDRYFVHQKPPTAKSKQVDGVGATVLQKKKHAAAASKPKVTPKTAVTPTVKKDVAKQKPTTKPEVVVHQEPYQVPGFVGVAELKRKQRDHLEKLQALADAGEWRHLAEHTSHADSGFDWWMFPIDRSSAGQGSKYQVTPGVIAVLKKDADFMRDYRRGVALVARSWGWDVDKNSVVTGPQQGWTGYQVRLGKMIHSLVLFGQKDLHDSMRQFVQTNRLESQLEGWIQTYLKPLAQ